MKGVKIQIPEGIQKVKDIFKSNGHDLFIVGGAVRDALLGKKPKDLDIATDATPDKIISMLKGHFNTKEVGKAFGVIIAVIDDEDVEIATFRKDIGSSDGRRPDEVEFTTIEEDVKRRDLTINALFYNIDTEEIVDLVGGIEDMRNGIIRTVGDADERFEEDRLRILRAIRFASRLGFEMTDDIYESISNNNSLEKISKNRIRDEFINCLGRAESKSKLFHMINGFGLFDWIFPGLSVEEFVDKGFSQDVILAHSLRGNDPREIRKVLSESTYTNDEVYRISYFIDFMKLSVDNAYLLKRKFDESKIYVSELIEFSIIACIEPGIVTAFVEYNPSITGHMLMDEGFSGKDIGIEMERRETKAFLYKYHGV